MRRGEAAFTLIELMIVIAIIAIIAAIAIPNLIEARKSANESAAVASLKTIATGEAIYREQDKDGDGTLDYGALADLSQYNIIDPLLGAGTKQGYRFGAHPSTTMPDQLWWATTEPVILGTTGDRYFGTNHNGLIYYTTDTAGATLDPATCTFTGVRVLGQ